VQVLFSDQTILIDPVQIYRSYAAGRVTVFFAAKPFCSISSPTT
jgi:hypothetical protein